MIGNGRRSAIALLPLHETLGRSSKGMKRALLVICLTVFCTVLATEGNTVAQAETAFLKQRDKLASFEGPTSELSCSGTGLTVFLRGDEVRHLDWYIVTSSYYARRQFYFEGAMPVFVVASVCSRYHSNGGDMEGPMPAKVKSSRLDLEQPNKDQTEMLQHAKFLMGDFRTLRKDFVAIK